MDHIPYAWQWVVNEILNLSIISDYDYVSFVATYLDRNTGDKHKVSPGVSSRGYTQEQLQSVFKSKKTNFNSVTSCGLTFTKPFSHLVHPYFEYILTLFDNYQRGVLPFPGCVSEQPSQVMEYFSIAQLIKYEFEAASIECANKKNTRKK